MTEVTREHLVGLELALELANDRAAWGMTNNLRDLIRLAEAAAAAQPGNWVECSDRLPAQYRDVPILLDDGSQRVGRINHAGTWLVASYQKCRNQYSAVVVAWFDTPAPKESE